MLVYRVIFVFSKSVPCDPSSAIEHQEWAVIVGRV